jgi:hypothetical protein
MNALHNTIKSFFRILNQKSPLSSLNNTGLKDGKDKVLLYSGG